MQQIRLEFNSFSDTQFQTEYPERRILLHVKKQSYLSCLHKVKTAVSRWIHGHKITFTWFKCLSEVNFSALPVSPKGLAKIINVFKQVAFKQK